MEVADVEQAPSPKRERAPVFMTFVVVGLLCLVFFGISQKKEEEDSDIAPTVEDKYVKKSGSKDNPLVWFTIRIGKKTFPKRLVFELFADVVPVTAENFRALCVGQNKSADGKRLTYRGSKFHEIIPGMMVRGGDIVSGNGQGGCSIYGPTFDNENFQLSHRQKYMLSMANVHGPDTISSQFFITTAPAPWLDGKHVVIGKVKEGHEIVDAIEAEGSSQGDASTEVTIVESGEIVTEEAARAQNNNPFTGNAIGRGIGYVADALRRAKAATVAARSPNGSRGGAGHGGEGAQNKKVCW